MFNISSDQECSSEMSSTSDIPTIASLAKKFQEYQMVSLLQNMALPPPPPLNPVFLNPELTSQILNFFALTNGPSLSTVTPTVSEEPPPFDNQGDVIIPSSDKEGWCRNKKYIEKTDSGFMCTVCKKTYGRYNSVSYHVTIYHRNPPIRCNIGNCQFTTREARYIHFHKYYRHGIQLPQNIDQGSRRCPHCRHVSKSPAMLEKHIKRHQLKEGEQTGRERTVSHSEPMEVEMEEIETKPRANTF